MRFLIELWYALFTDKHFEDSVISILKVEGQVPAKYLKTRLEGIGYKLTIFDFYLAMSKLEDKEVVKSATLVYYDQGEVTNIAEVNYCLISKSN